MFALKIPVTSPSLHAIKSELTRTLPNVKSSHRCEAVARGFGFRTYASLLAMSRSLDSTITVANGGNFTSYLADHGYDASPVVFYQAVGRVALQNVLEKVPKLTACGIGVGGPKQKSDRTWESTTDWQARFVAERAAMPSEERGGFLPIVARVCAEGKAN